MYILKFPAAGIYMPPHFDAPPYTPRRVLQVWGAEDAQNLVPSPRISELQTRPKFAQPRLSRVKGRSSPARGCKFGCVCSYMSSHYVGMR